MRLLELVDFNHHQNEIALFRSLVGEDYFYEKHAFSKSAELLIKNEFEGYEWFNNKINKVNDVILCKNKLIIPEYSGLSIPSVSGITGNEVYIERILHLYMHLWSSENPFVVHGDFALGNFIFGDNDIHIIDWEHFHYSSVENYGYDFVHLIFLLLKKDKFKLNKRTRDFLVGCFKSLRDSVTYENVIVERPFQSSGNYIANNLESFFKHNIATDKFEFAYWNRNDLIRLDQILT